MRKYINKHFTLIVLFLGNFCVVQAGDMTSINALVGRVTPGWADRIIFKSIPSDKDVFTLDWINGKLVIGGNNNNSLAVGFNHYLKYYCHVDVTWYGLDAKDLPSQMPEIKEKIRRETNYKNRFFLNYCTFGYSIPWWNWNDWERLIDWMALNGVNMPLAVTGQEAVWYNVWRKLGLSDEQIRGYFTGPAYLPWHRMANIDRWDGPLPKSWLTGQLELQKKIVARERSLNMRPVLPAFVGHVPAELKSRFPEAEITPLDAWEKFPEGYNTSFLDPLDPLFKKIQRLFLEEQAKLFGTDHIYGADPFNEVKPPSWEPSYLATVSKTIYQSMADVDSSATWLQMGWIFYHGRKNWTDVRVDSFVTAVPDQKMILLDFYAEKQEIWKQTNHFFGQPYIWCYLGNFGGNTVLAGDLAEVELRMDDAFKNGGTNLSGVGCTLEGLDMNPMMYEFVLERAWSNEPVDVNQWVRNWAKRRSGQPDKNVEKGWKILFEKVYISPAGNHTSLINGRPGLKYKPRWPSKISYQNTDLLQAWELLLQSDLKTHETYRFDLVNIGRQVLENYFSDLKNQFVVDYHQQNLQALVSDSSRMIGLINDLDTLAGTQSSLLLGKWLTDAGNTGKNKREQLYFRKDARNLITTWSGPDHSLNDYANRSWSGLLKDFYATRWKMFLHKVINSIKENTFFDEDAFHKEVAEFEWQWVQKDKDFPCEPSGDAVKISERLYKKYKGAIK